MDKAFREKLVGIVNEIMNVDIGALDPSAKFSSIPSWDSFNNLMLISKFEEEYKVRFTAVEIEQTQTVGDLFLLMERKIQKAQ